MATRRKTTKKRVLPMTAEFEAGRRQLTDSLSALLAQLNAERGLIGGEGNVARSRLATDELNSLGLVDEDAIGRGIFNSGIRTTNRAQTSLGYERQRQDLASNMARQIASLSGREAEARGAYSRGLTELLLERARQNAASRSLGSAAPVAVRAPAPAPVPRRRPVPAATPRRRPPPRRTSTGVTTTAYRPSSKFI